MGNPSESIKKLVKRKLRWYQFSIRTLMIFMTLCMVAISMILFFTPSGVREAQAQIRHGHLTLYTYGLPISDQFYDPTTGLPLEAIEGCMVDETTQRRAKEHNDYIRNWIAQGNTPPNSLRAYNHLIAEPFSNIIPTSFVSITPGKSVQLDGLEVTYTIHTGCTGSVYHDFSVKTDSSGWSHTVFNEGAKNFGVALVAEGRILALSYLADGQETFAGKTFQTIQLFDRPTGISLNDVYREKSR
jgi:hypothetical protein